MNNNDCRMKNLEKKILDEQNPDKLWKLNEEQVNYLKQLGYIIIPELFQIRTISIRCQDKLMREINYAYNHGIRMVYKRLNRFQQELLDVLDVEYIPFKYKIRKPV